MITASSVRAARIEKEWVDVSEQRYERDPEQRDTRMHSCPSQPRQAAFRRAPGGDDTRGRYHGRRAAFGRRGGRDGRRSRRCGRRRRAGPEGPELAQHRLRRARSHGAHGQVGLGRHRHLGCQHPRCRFTLRHRRRRVRQLLALRHGGDRRLVHDAALFMRGRQSHRSLRRPRARRHVRLDRDRGHARGLGSLRCTRLGRLRRGSRDWQHVSRHRRLLHAGHRRNRQHPARGLRQPSRRVPAQRLQLPLG